MNAILHYGLPRETVCVLLPILMMAVGVNEASAQNGACCLGNGSCLETDNSGCDTVGGDFLGAGTSCAGADCSGGACCLPDETCTQGNLNICINAGGSYQGLGTSCELVCDAPISSVFRYQGQINSSRR